MTTEKRVRDVVQFVEPEQVSRKLDEACARFETLAAAIWYRTDLAEGARVFPNMLRCIARQLQVLGASATLPIEVAAFACRNVFELNLRTRLMTKYPDQIKDFWAERVFEEKSLCEAMKRLHAATYPGATASLIDDRIEQIRTYAEKWKLTKPPVLSVIKLAEMVDSAEEYKTLYGFYSKYTHGTAWLVNARDAERDGAAYRDIFLIQTQIYAIDSYTRIDEFVRDRSSD